MEVSVIKKPRLVVALDVGSTYSGYAWQWRKNFEENRSNVEFNSNWGTGGLQLHKTATCLLLNKDKEVNSIGYLAEQRFCNMMDCEEEMRDTWYFFKRFKTLLYRDSFKEEISIDDYNGQVLPFKLVMASFIKGLKNHFLAMMEKKYLIKKTQRDVENATGADKGKEVLNFKSILWVVTLPAIWSDEAKMFMRQAAENAGIDRKNLLLALEPEAAALYCINLPPELRVSMNNFGEKGDKFMVCDLGGGTADISALKVLDDGRLQELCAGTGSLVGGQNINDAFFQVCKDVFEGNAWHEISVSKNSVDLLEMEEDFERNKVTIGSNADIDQYIGLKIPGSLKEMLKEGSVKLKDAEEINKQFQVKAGKFSFKADYIRKKLFAETVARALKAVEESMQRTKVNTIVLVGGFAESPIVVEEVRKMVSSKCQNVEVVVPTSPFKAVLHGAVLFGHDPMIFRSRISRATFGVSTTTLFRKGEHDENKKFTHRETGKLYCRDIFAVHVKKGKPVILGNQLEKKTYFPLYKDQRSVKFSIVASTSEESPTYTTDPGCRKIAEIEVDVSSTLGSDDRSVSITMVYGGTELSVIAIEEKTGLEYNITSNFDTL